ncbi:MAG: orotidine-5'-phosphate decarboxylase [Candidatus Doudnabacteria bacterium]
MGMFDRLIPALDMVGMEEPMPIVNALRNLVPVYKIHAWSDTWLSSAIDKLYAAGAVGVWADYKLHDTPDTVAKRAAKIKSAGADWITVHAGGGPKMIEAAKKSGLYVIAVTLLTSLTDKMIKDLYHADPSDVVLLLAEWAREGGADALVCSPKQVGTLNHWRSGFDDLSWNTKLIVPGTRSAGADVNDQQQVDTPYNAILNGADYLVVGRQVTGSSDPLNAIQKIAEEIEPAIQHRMTEETWRYEL